MILGKNLDRDHKIEKIEGHDKGIKHQMINHVIFEMEILTIVLFLVTVRI